MENKFTPGPWAFSRWEQFGDTRFYVAQADGAPYTPNYSDVATLIAETVSGERVRVQESNARLIAAAPEMLEVLDNIGGLSRALRAGGPDPVDLQDLSDALQEAVDMANTMVAKATGEQA